MNPFAESRVPLPERRPPLPSEYDTDAYLAPPAAHPLLARSQAQHAGRPPVFSGSSMTGLGVSQARVKSESKAFVSSSQVRSEEVVKGTWDVSQERAA